MTHYDTLMYIMAHYDALMYVMTHYETLMSMAMKHINHITETSMKVAKPIGLLYKQNRFLPETILKTLYTSRIHPYLSYGI